jgi:hypothetical protein
MQHRDRAIELRLHRVTAGRVEVDRPEVFAAVIMSGLRASLPLYGRREREADRDDPKQQDVHSVRSHSSTPIGLFRASVSGLTAAGNRR